MPRPRLTTSIRRTARQFIDILDWLVGLLERCVVLFIGWSVLFVGYELLRNGQKTEVLRTIDQRWRAFLIILIPLFYSSIRKFLEQVEEAYGMKRHLVPRQGPIEDERPQAHRDAR